GPRTSRVAITLLRPMTLLLGVTLAGGAIISFAPQMISDPVIVAVALALMSTTAAWTRWRLGALADRFGPQRFIPPLVVLTVLTMALAAWSVRETSAPLFLLACALLGCSYGGLQNLTLVTSFAAVTPRHYG